MDAFNLRHQLIADYSTYSSSFINIKNDRIQKHVQHELQAGVLWSDPLIQLNPTLEPGAWVDDLAQSNILHPLCQKLFQLKSDGWTGRRW